jgi:hypothetical protein
MRALLRPQSRDCATRSDVFVVVSFFEPVRCVERESARVGDVNRGREVGVVDDDEGRAMLQRGG